MTPDIMPFVHVRGTWGEMGAQVGQMFAPLIERHVEAWLEHVARETGAGRDDALATAGLYAAPIQEHAAFLWEELEGMARGSRLPMNRLLLLQARAEVMRLSRDRLVPPTLECTTFAVGGRRTANGAVLYGQNVDLVPFLSEYGVVVRQHPKDAPATLLYTTARLLGHNGLNEAESASAPTSSTIRRVGVRASHVIFSRAWPYGRIAPSTRWTRRWRRHGRPRETSSSRTRMESFSMPRSCARQPR